jgi:hypothetical protein
MRTFYRSRFGLLSYPRHTNYRPFVTLADIGLIKTGGLRHDKG